MIYEENENRYRYPLISTKWRPGKC